MKKVICDICGTAYPSSAASCPICGSSREYALENQDAEALLDAEIAAAVEEVPAVPRKKNKEIFDYAEVNQIKPSSFAWVFRISTSAAMLSATSLK